MIETTIMWMNLNFLPEELPSSSHVIFACAPVAGMPPDGVADDLLMLSFFFYIYAFIALISSLSLSTILRYTSICFCSSLGSAETADLETVLFDLALAAATSESVF